MVDFVEKSLQANVASVVASSNNAMEKLHLLYRMHTDFLKTQPAIPKIIFSLLVSNKNLTLKNRILSVIESYVGQIQSILVKGQFDGDITFTIEASAAALQFIGMIQPLIILSQAGNSSVDVFKQELWAVYARGIKK